MLCPPSRWFYMLEGHPIMRNQELTQAFDLQHIQPEGRSYWGLSICHEPQGPHIRFIGETGLEDPKWWPRNAALHASLCHQIRQKWVANLLLDVGHGKHTKGTFCCLRSSIPVLRGFLMFVDYLIVCWRLCLSDTLWHWQQYYAILFCTWLKFSAHIHALYI